MQSQFGSALCTAEREAAVKTSLKGRLAHRLQRGDDGFTLIELLIVIVILGILSAIVVFSVGGIGDKGQGSACKTDYETITTAEEAYFAGASVYGTMAQLTGTGQDDGVSGSLLHSASKWYDVQLPTDRKSYAVIQKAGVTTCPANP